MHHISIQEEAEVVNKKTRAQTKKKSHPKLLFISAEALFLPQEDYIGNPYYINPMLNDHQALPCLISDLYYAGVDIHLVEPFYRTVMRASHPKPDRQVCMDLPASQVYLAQDRIFYYSNQPDANPDSLNIRISIAFQREVLQHWIPLLKPGLVICHDWMCGMIPAAVKICDLPSVMSLYRTETQYVPLWIVEDIGLDTALSIKKKEYGCGNSPRKKIPKDF